MYNQKDRPLAAPNKDVIVGGIHESPDPQLTTCGKIVESVIQSIPAHLHVTIDRYVIMPNHVHLIAIIMEEDMLGEIRESPVKLYKWIFFVGLFVNSPYGTHRNNPTNSKSQPQWSGARFHGEAISRHIVSFHEGSAFISHFIHKSWLSS